MSLRFVPRQRRQSERYYFFFFYRCGAHRDLHSFPTRRSSDLKPFGLERIREQVEAMEMESLRFYRHRFDLDRKSTRLNSSHPSISYAVFCLKKKSVGEIGGSLLVGNFVDGHINAYNRTNEAIQ